MESSSAMLRNLIRTYGRTKTTCDVCGTTKEVLRDEFWGQTFNCCPRGHTPQCYICKRFKQAEVEEYVNLGDGRKLCSDCYSIAILDKKQLKSLMRTVHKFHEGLGLKLCVDDYAYIRLVDKNMMSILGDPAIVGCTLYYSGSIMTIEKCSKKGENIEVKKKSKRSSRAFVTMAILFGQPDVMMGATLVHEMMHMWLDNEGCSVYLEKEVEEGICEVMAYKWIKWFFDSGVGFSNKTSEQVQFTRKMKEFCIEELSARSDVYGAGFRKVKQAVTKYGLKTTIDHIVEKRCLPRDLDRESQVIDSFRMTTGLINMFHLATDMLRTSLGMNAMGSHTHS